jgi:RNA polymerase sigma-70 factor (ECF subfamily)
MNQPAYSQLPLAADPGACLERHRAYLQLLAGTHLRSRPAAKLDASDIVQQTLLDAYAKREQFRGLTEGELAAWLRQILKNNLLNAARDQRRDKRDIRREQPLAADVDDSFSRTDQWLLAIQSSPSQRAVQQEDLLRLSQALTELPEAQREAIELHHLQGLKLAEVAAAMERTEGSVAGLLFRGLAKLHSLLDE